MDDNLLVSCLLLSLGAVLGRLGEAEVGLQVFTS